MEELLTQQALNYLKRIKPYDGWSVDNYTNNSGKKFVMLTRRNVPLSKKTSGYIAIAYDEHDTKCIVGITSRIGEAGKTVFYRGEVLVEQDGTVARDQKQLRLSLKKNENVNVNENTNSKNTNSKGTKEEALNQMREQNRRDRENARQSMRQRERERERTTRTNNAGTNNTNIVNPLSDEQTSELAKLGLIFIGVVTILRIVATFTFAFNAIALPIIILYAMMNCPSNESFDAKKELKRVWRGHHLPEGHQDKPADDWLSRTVARVTAAVMTEASTAFGYEVSFMSLGGACTLATVVVPSIHIEFYWIGAFGSWRYIFKRELPTRTTGMQQQHQ